MRRPRSSRALLLGATAVVVATRLAVGLAVHGPRVFPDETGYLAAARWLGSSGATFDMGPAPFYHPGYSLLLTPATALTESPMALYRWAMVVNALAWGGTFLLLRRLLGRLWPPPGDGWATVAALVACLYPAAVLTASLAWVESVLPLALVGFLLVADRVAERPSVRSAAALGATAAAAFLVHPRAAVVPVVAAGLLVVLRRQRRITTAVAVMGVAVAGLGVLAVVGLNAAVESALYGPGRITGAGGDGLLTADRWVEAVRRAAGQAWYLSVATWGLAPVGVLALVRAARTSTTAATALATTAGLFVVSAAFATGTRTDALVFGRYNEAVLPVVLGAGVLAHARLATASERRRALLVAGGAVAVLGVALRLGQDLLRRPTGLVAFNVLGIEPGIRFFDGDLRVGWLTLAALAALAGLVLVARWPEVLPAALAVAFVASAASTWFAVVRPDDRRLVPLRDLPEAVVATTGGAPVSYDWADYDDRAPWAYQFWEPDLEVDGFDRGDEPRRPWVLARGGWAAGVAEGARVVAVDPFLDQALWARPPVLADLSPGSLLPTPFPGPLPDAATRRRVEVTEDGLTLEPGATGTVTVTVAHEGEGAAWPPFAGLGLGDASGRVRVGGRITDAEGRLLAERLRAELPRQLEPGDEVTVELEVLAEADDGSPLPPGSYELGVDLVQEAFPDTFDPDGAVTIPLEVRR